MTSKTLSSPSSVRRPIEYGIYNVVGVPSKALLVVCVACCGLIALTLFQIPYLHELMMVEDIQDKPYFREETNNDNYNDAQFRILCTTRRSSINYGSYKIRCLDFERWANKCAPNVQIHVGKPIETFYGPYRNWPQPYSTMKWDATVLVKTLPDMQRLQSGVYTGKLGNLFVDMVDWFYVRNETGIPQGPDLILQTKEQQEDMFPNRKFHVVEHWYNSYPDDLTATSTKEPPYIPPIRVIPSPSSSVESSSTIREKTEEEHQGLRMLTVWNTLAADTGSGCPNVDALNSKGSRISYDCIEQEFNILEWYTKIVGNQTSPMLSYLDYYSSDSRDRGGGSSIRNNDELPLLPPTMRFNNSDDRDHDRFQPSIYFVDPVDEDGTINKERKHQKRRWIWNTTADVERIVKKNEHNWGRGMLYYHLYWQYDVLVVPAKDHEFKLKYGNVQRAVSQMRSGVPTLVEVWGPVMEQFVMKYNYTRCAFIQHWPTSGQYMDSALDNITFWTWEEAVEQMMEPNNRRHCQQLGLEIVQHYSPSKIGKKFLRAVGYEGNDFEC